MNLGYGVNYDIESNTIDLTPQNSISHETVDSFLPNGTAVLSITNHIDQRNIAESGSFQAEDNQTLILNITSDIKGGTVGWKKENGSIIALVYFRTEET